MRKPVEKWIQEGRLCIWRYPDPGGSWRGWHLSADVLGCRSIRHLLDRMRGGNACHRTLKLEPVTDAILAIPNHGRKAAERFAKLRIEYRLDSEAMRFSPDGELLMLTVGPGGAGNLSAALDRIEAGEGDFSIAMSDDRTAEHLMLWWWPRPRHCEQGKRIEK